ncbi:unnamed protein product [Sphagnum compactum]
MVNDKVKELRLGLEEEEQSHDDDHGISSAVARGLTLAEPGDIKQAAAVFEEAEDVFEQTSGADHLDRLDVCNNLAGTYDALGRIEDAITLLEEMLEVKEEKLGTMHPYVQDDHQCLHELLNQQGRSTRHKKFRKLVELLSNARKVFQTSK